MAGVVIVGVDHSFVLRMLCGRGKLEGTSCTRTRGWFNLISWSLGGLERYDAMTRKAVKSM